MRKSLPLLKLAGLLTCSTCSPQTLSKLHQLRLQADAAAALQELAAGDADADFDADAAPPAPDGHAGRMAFSGGQPSVQVLSLLPHRGAQMLSTTAMACGLAMHA